MLYLVEVRSLGHDLADTTTKMHAWLDEHSIEARSFLHSSSGPGTTFRLGFRLETDAAAFAEAFGGRLLWTDPQGAELWVTGQTADDDARSD